LSRLFSLSKGCIPVIFLINGGFPAFQRPEHHFKGNYYSIQRFSFPTHVFRGVSTGQKKYETYFFCEVSVIIDILTPFKKKNG
jgi:hypothetical protein